MGPSLRLYSVSRRHATACCSVLNDHNDSRVSEAMTVPARALHLVEEPRYSFAEADHLAGVSRGTSRRWLAGYSYRGTSGDVVHLPPVTSPSAADASFIDLVEVVAIGGLKEQGFGLTQIRKIVASCEELLGVARPLTTLTFKTGGRQIFVEVDDGRLVEVLGKRGRQAWTEVLAPFLQTLEYEHDVARRWWPQGKSSPVVVDPAYAYGLPVIKNTGVRTEILFERFESGELFDEIASDFNLEARDVERAIQFEATRLKFAA